MAPCEYARHRDIGLTQIGEVLRIWVHGESIRERRRIATTFATATVVMQNCWPPMVTIGDDDGERLAIDISAGHPAGNSHVLEVACQEGGLTWIYRGHTQSVEISRQTPYR